MNLKKFIKDIEAFEVRHKLLAFALVMVLTIIVIRLITQVYDPNPIILGLEIHHFDYGLIGLAIINLLLIFGKKWFKTYLVILAIATGQIVDDIWYIKLNANPANVYSASLASAGSLLVIIIIIIVLIMLVRKIEEKIEPRAATKKLKSRRATRN